jgi:hypothetical protein
MLASSPINVWRFGAISIVFCALIVCPLNAQTAQLYGSVKDPSQAVVSTAEVTLTNEATQISRTAKTNKDGQYSFPFLQPGKYSALVQASGFESQSKAGIELQVDQQARWDIQLQVGSVRQTVGVEAGPSLVNSTDGSVSTVIDRTFVENLPLNGRSFQSLFELTPGTVIAKSTASNAGQFSINGQRSSSNYLMVDGVSANIGIAMNATASQAPAGTLASTTALGGTNNLVSVDALQEFQIQTSSFAPEYGRSVGGQVQIVTRSGTNSFHGDVFDYFRNDKLDANNWFSNQIGAARSPERQNDFGGVFGGPIVKNRTFFFVSYEGLQLLQPKTLIGVDVPTAAVRALTPPSLQPFVNAFPLPNGQDLGNGLAVLNTSFSNPSSLNVGSVRIDHRFSDRWSVFGRFNEAPSVAATRATATGSVPSEIDNTSTDTRTITGGVTGIISPTVTLDLRVNWSLVTGQSSSALDNYGGATPPSASLLYPINGNAALSHILFSLAPSNFSSGEVANNKQEQYNVTSTLASVHGRHSLKYGLDLRWLTPSVAITNSTLSLAFSSGTGFNVSPYPVGSILSGTANTGSVATHPPAFPMRWSNYSFFAQDTWQISSSLTMTYGLRWDINPPAIATGNSLFDAVTGVDTPATLALAPSGTPLWHTSYTNIAPRIGLAYALSRDPRRETVLRIGLGVFHDIIEGGSFLQQAETAPNTNTLPLSNVTFPLSNLAAPTLPAKPPYSLFYAIDPNVKTPQIYEYNFSLERALGERLKGSATYVGSLGRNLEREESISNPNPTFATVFIDKTNGVSSYNALQLQLQGRLAPGLQVLGGYVWSHSIDTVSLDTMVDIASSTYLPPSAERASSDFDVRHAATAALTYQIPGVTGPSPAGALLRDWSVDLMFRARTADPVNVYLLRNLGYGLFYFRPDLVPGVPVELIDPNSGGGWRINSAAFQVPSTLRVGDLGRNALRGFPLAQADLAIHRQFSLSERMKLQLRGELFNVLNHPNFADPSGYMGSPSASGALVIPSAFGRSASMLSAGLGGLSPIYQIGGPRSIQLALKLVF